MNIIGQWKIKKLGTFDEELNFSLLPVEEAIKMEMWAENPGMAEAIYEFTPDGKMELNIPIPEGVTKEDIEEEGLEIKEGNRVVVETKNWKEENGEFLYDSEEHREVCGEILSPWDKIEINGNIATIYNGDTAMYEVERI